MDKTHIKNRFKTKQGRRIAEGDKKGDFIMEEIWTISDNKIDLLDLLGDVINQSLKYVNSIAKDNDGCISSLCEQKAAKAVINQLVFRMIEKKDTKIVTKKT